MLIVLVMFGKTIEKLKLRTQRPTIDSKFKFTITTSLVEICTHPLPSLKFVGRLLNILKYLITKGSTLKEHLF